MVAFSINEYDTFEASKEVFIIARSAGQGKGYNRFGDSGEKVYGDNGIFWMLTFGKDSFRVSIVAKREKHAEYFAAFVERAIEEFLKRSEEQKKVSKTPVYGIIENPLKNDPFWNNKNKFFEYELKSEYYLRHRY